MSEIIEFSSRALEVLERRKEPLYELTGKSIRDLRHEGKVITEWPDQEFENLPSRKSQVVPILYIPESLNRSTTDQIRNVSDYSEKFSIVVPDVKIIIGEVPDYVELALQYFDRTSERMFDMYWGSSRIPWVIRKHMLYRIYTRTMTPLGTRQGSFMAMVTHSDRGIEVTGWPKEQGTHACGVTALVVPK